MSKVGRNDPCPCGSGKKYKKCCLPLINTADNHLSDTVKQDEQTFLFDAMNNIRRYMLEQKPHIKEYEKARKLHSEIVDGMVDYYQQGKFEQRPDPDCASPLYADKKAGGKSESLILLESDFDLETREGTQAFYDIMIYKNAPNINCITEEFIAKHRYRKQEKIEFLNSMLNSILGLFEITDTHSDEGYAYLKEVFTGKEHVIIDIGLSGNRDYSNVYLYTRIITYHGISFNTGLSLLFEKSDSFIENFIRHQKNNYTLFNEFSRFIELYNHFSKDPHKFIVIANNY